MRSPTALAVAVVGLMLVVMVLLVAVVLVRKHNDTTLTKDEQVVRQWQQAATANPKSTVAHTGYGLALLRVGRKGEAKQQFEQSLAINPKDWSPALQLALLIKDSDPARAQTLLQTSYDNAPAESKVIPMVAMGDMLLARKDLAGAQKAYETAISANPMIVDGHVGLAKALEASGNPAGALDEYKEAARFNPTDSTISAEIARLTQVVNSGKKG